MNMDEKLTNEIFKTIINKYEAFLIKYGNEYIVIKHERHKDEGTLLQLDSTKLEKVFDKTMTDFKFCERDIFKITFGLIDNEFKNNKFIPDLKIYSHNPSSILEHHSDENFYINPLMFIQLSSNKFLEIDTSCSCMGCVTPPGDIRTFGKPIDYASTRPDLCYEETIDKIPFCNSFVFKKFMYDTYNIEIK